jgi:uncharacterized protein YegL
MSLKLKKATKSTLGGKSDTTLLVLIVDRSGSMTSIREDMNGGIKQLFEDQAKEDGTCLVTLAQFDTTYDLLCENTPVGDIESYDLVPSGATALLDALGKTITQVSADQDKIPAKDRPAHVIVAIITDGQENASKEWKLADVKALIEKQTGAGWTFTYLGANQDAIAEGHKMGIPAAQSMTFTADHDHVHQSYNSMSTNVSGLRSGGQGGYSDDERAKSHVQSK